MPPPSNPSGLRQCRSVWSEWFDLAVDGQRHDLGIRRESTAAEEVRGNRVDVLYISEQKKKKKRDRAAIARQHIPVISASIYNL